MKAGNFFFFLKIPYLPMLYIALQVEMICERMLKEREAELREEYERILHTKLADQYEQFVKFTYDQLHRAGRSAETPSCKSSHK